MEERMVIFAFALVMHRSASDAKVAKSCLEKNHFVIDDAISELADR
jgi:hypothetical protein